MQKQGLGLSGVLLLTLILTLGVAGCGQAEVELQTSAPTVTSTSAPTSTATPEPSHTPTLTPEPTATETPTRSSTPTAPPAPTTEPTGTAEPSATPVCGELAVLDPGLAINIRSGPGTNYGVIGSLDSNHKIVVLGMTEDGTWVVGDLVDDEENVVAKDVWITGNTNRWVEITCGKDNVDVVAQHEIPPTPTAESTTATPEAAKRPGQTPTEQSTQPAAEATPTNETAPSSEMPRPEQIEPGERTIGRKTGQRWLRSENYPEWRLMDPLPIGTLCLFNNDPGIYSANGRVGSVGQHSITVNFLLSSECVPNMDPAAIRSADGVICGSRKYGVKQVIINTAYYEINGSFPHDWVGGMQDLEPGDYVFVVGNPVDIMNGNGDVVVRGYQ